GRTALSESGPPKFISTTARRGISAAVQRLGEQPRQRRNIFWRGLRQHAMPEIEDERTAGERGANLANLALHRRSADNECNRVEITLHRYPPLQLFAGKTAGEATIDADRVDATLCRIALIEEPSGTREPDYRNRREALLQPRRDALCRLDDPTLEAAFGQDPRPTVEQL